MLLHGIFTILLECNRLRCVIASCLTLHSSMVHDSSDSLLARQFLLRCNIGQLLPVQVM